MFKFNQIGDLISYPEDTSLAHLHKIHDDLIKQREYIKASRIQHLINVRLMEKQNEG